MAVLLAINIKNIYISITYGLIGYG